MARLLIAEDDNAVRDFTRRAMELAGHDVMVAHDGGEAAQLLFSGVHEFDLLLTDIKMPIMDGIALALRAARDLPQMPVLLMTGFADQRMRARSLRAIISGIIQKPFTLKEITIAVNEALEKAAAPPH